jgi:enoyl-CoA hydratase
MATERNDRNDGALVLDSRPRDGVLVLTLNRPEKRNALSRALLSQMASHLEGAGSDDSVRCVVLAGAGKAFSAGADIGDMVERGLDSYLDPERLAPWQAIENFPKPLIAAIHGYALGGGCELAMLCDIIVAASDARFGQPEINIGVLPGDGGTQRLPRLVGKNLAMRMILAGEFIEAPEAERRGLVAETVAPERLMARAVELAGTIAERPAIALQLAKRAVLSAFEMPLSEGLPFEREQVTKAFATEDRAEGMRAFLEKRPPRFTGR